jgi:hypothetical protein
MNKPMNAGFHLPGGILSHFRLVTIRAYVSEHDEARDHRR